MTKEWEVAEKLPRFEDRYEFDVQIYGQERRARMTGNNSYLPNFAPGTWYFTDCTHPAQNMLFDQDDVTAWRRREGGGRE